MDIANILSRVDHTLLRVDCTEKEIFALCDDAIKYKTASVCIPGAFVKAAKEYVGDKMTICTVIGFPNGYSTKEVKCLEAAEYIKNGAEEIDTVINICDLKDKKYDKILDELTAIKKVCKDKILKVIIECCLLTEEEKIKMCQLVSLSGADYIKTSTGFSKGGATKEDIKLFADHVAENVKIKAAGGISTLQDAEDFINLGASRLGTSRIVKLVKENNYENVSDTSY
ncbi:MAG: deoxyribose-phosphate aldolase [Clostridia bacterium]|nr:deoxyribose-phosphate aldolase [Clostridia bacterium]